MTLTPTTNPIQIPPADDQLRQPSEMLLATFIDSGSPVIDCEWCGRVHFDANGEFMEPGELDRLMTKLEREPDKYHTHDGGPHWGLLCGLQYVAGCPCNRASVLEAFLWDNRFRAADYLARRARHDLLTAHHINTLVENLPELLNPTLPIEDPPAPGPAPAVPTPEPELPREPTAEFLLAEGSRCTFRRESDGRQCSGWKYPDGHRFAKPHVHFWICGKPIDGHSGETCDEAEGHSGLCKCIPF